MAEDQHSTSAEQKQLAPLAVGQRNRTIEQVLSAAIDGFVAMEGASAVVSLFKTNWCQSEELLKSLSHADLTDKLKIPLPVANTLLEKGFLKGGPPGPAGQGGPLGQGGGPSGSGGQSAGATNDETKVWTQVHQLLATLNLPQLLATLTLPQTPNHSSIYVDLPKICAHLGQPRRFQFQQQQIPKLRVLLRTEMASIYQDVLANLNAPPPRNALCVSGPMGAGKSFMLYALSCALKSERTKYRVTFFHDCSLWGHHSTSVACRFFKDEIAASFYDDRLPAHNSPQTLSSFEWAQRVQTSTDPVTTLHEFIVACSSYCTASNLRWIVVYDQINGISVKNRQEYPFAYCFEAQSLAFRLLSYSSNNEETRNPVKLVGPEFNPPFQYAPSDFQSVLTTSFPLPVGAAVSERIEYVTNRVPLHVSEVISLTVASDLFRTQLGNLKRKTVHSINAGAPSSATSSSDVISQDTIQPAAASDITSQDTAIELGLNEHRQKRLKEDQGSHSDYRKQLSPQQTADLDDCVLAMILGAPIQPNKTVSMDKKLMVERKVGLEIFLDPLTPIAETILRDTLTSSKQLPQLLSASQAIVYSLITDPNYTKDLKGRVVERYVIDTLERTRHLSLKAYLRHPAPAPSSSTRVAPLATRATKPKARGAAGTETKIAEPSPLSSPLFPHKTAVDFKIGRVIRFPAGSRLPPDALDNKLTTLFVPTSPNYEDVDLLLYHADHKTLVSIQVTIETPPSDHVKRCQFFQKRCINEKEKRFRDKSLAEEWAVYCGISVNQVKLVWCVPDSSIDQLGELSDPHYATEFAELGAAFNVLSSLKL